MSQSLIHQVSVSDDDPKPDTGSVCFRSQFQIFLDQNLDIKSQYCLNPLFIRSQFQILQKAVRRAKTEERVSIPYSSGLSFRWRYKNPCPPSSHRGVSIPYSSGLSFRCMYIRDGIVSKIESQSLIHQVSVSDSIPFNSKAKGGKMSQSLIHQVSVSDGADSLDLVELVMSSLNPLFIRSQFQIWREC